MENDILNSVNDCMKAASFLREKCSLKFMADLSELIASCYHNGGKLLVAGNGGSLCDAMHFAEELTGYYRARRPALPAIALSDPGHLTCVGNDTSFDRVFARAIEALGKPDDIFIALTTSGNSQNLIEAVQAAKGKALKTVSFLGKTGGKLKGLCDLEWIVEGFQYSDRIQEAHMAAIHIVIEMVEQRLFSSHEGKQYSSSSACAISEPI